MHFRSVFVLRRGASVRTWAPRPVSFSLVEPVHGMSSRIRLHTKGHSMMGCCCVHPGKWELGFVSLWVDMFWLRVSFAHKKEKKKEQCHIIKWYGTLWEWKLGHTNTILIITFFCWAIALLVLNLGEKIFYEQLLWNFIYSLEGCEWRQDGT